MRVIGFDPGLRRTGWGVVDVAGNRLSHVANGVCATEPGGRAVRLVRPPEVMSHGFVGGDEEPALMEGVRQLVTDMLGGEGDRVDWAAMHETLKDDLAAYLHRQTHRRPLVLPVMMEV